MKPAIVADEMFPEGAGPYMEIEEVLYNQFFNEILSFFRSKFQQMSAIERE